MSKWLLSTVMLAAMVAGARAEPPSEVLTTQTRYLPSELVRRPLVLTHGMVELATHAEMSLSSDANYLPVSVAPDLRYGVTDRLTVGLIHSNRAAGFEGQAGNGLCLGGEANGCSTVYNRTGLDGMFSLSGGGSAWALALRGYAMFRGHSDMVPFGVTGGGGVRARWHKGQLALVLDPMLAVAYTRDGDTELLAQFLGRVQYQAGPNFALYAGAGYYGPVDEAGMVPLMAGVLFAVDENIDVGASGALSDASDGVDARVLNLTFVYRM